LDAILGITPRSIQKGMKTVEWLPKQKPNLLFQRQEPQLRTSIVGRELLRQIVALCWRPLRIRYPGDAFFRDNSGERMTAQRRLHLLDVDIVRRCTLDSVPLRAHLHPRHHFMLKICG
jgi:hypothetical protein